MRLQPPAQLRGRQRVAGPEADERIGVLRVSVAQPSEQQKRGYEPRVQVAPRRAGPAQQLRVRRRVEVELRGRLGNCRAVPAGDDRAVSRGAEDLDRIVQRRLLADHDAADGEPGVQGKLPKVLQEVALAGAEPAAEKHAPGGTIAGPLDQRQEPVLDLRLPAAEQPDRVPGRHAGPQCLEGPPLPGHQVETISRDAHRTASSRTPSRTIAAYGFGRRRSLTSSATLNCRAL